MNVRGVAVAALIGFVAIPALAAASSGPTATAVRIGDHPAYVRVVVDFAGGGLKANEVTAIGISRTGASVGVSHASGTAGTWTGYGVTARLAPSSTQLTVALSFAPHRMKYLSYAVVTRNRLAIDLWKSAPPSGAAVIRKGAGNCLTLRTWHVSPGSIAVSGRERNIFEHTFRVVVRGANGRTIGTHIAVHGSGAWSTHVRYRAAHRQKGTLEAVAFSAKDGALACIAQVRVTLPAS
jgi:hypothetical protein